MHLKILTFCIITTLLKVTLASDLVVIGQKIEQDPTFFHGQINVFSEQEMKRADIKDVRDIAESAPSFHIIGSTSARYMTPFIRGMGNQDLNLPDDVSVSFYLNEVPLPRYAFESNLIELEQVAILKGPQGTLFGKNNQAGAILLTTKVPHKENGSRVALSAGNLGQRSAMGSTHYSLSKNNNLQASTAIVLKQQDGFIEDKVLDKKLGEKTDQGIRQAFVYRPSDARQIELNVSLQRQDGVDPMFVARGTDEYPVTGQNISPDFRRDVLTSSLKMVEQIAEHELTFVSAFNYYDFSTKYDEADEFIARDALTARVGPILADSLINDPDSLYRTVDEYQRQYFSELRLRTPINDHMTLTSGVNYLHSNYRLIFFVDTFGGMGPDEIFQNVQLRNDSFSLFSQASLFISEKMELQLGIRGNYDKKMYDSYHSSNPLDEYVQSTSEVYRDLTSKLSLMYYWNDSHISYTSIARGYRPGGYPSFQFNNYSGIGADQSPFNKSVSWNYELGHKFESVDQRLKVSLSSFYNQVLNNQVRVRDPESDLSLYENIDTQIFGGEVEFRYQFLSPFTLGTFATYTNSRFSETVATQSEIVIEKNNRLANIPYWSGGGYIEYFNEVKSLAGGLGARVAYSYLGSRMGENTNKTYISSHGLWRSRVFYQKDQMEVAFNVSNIFDKQYESKAYFFESLQTEVSAPGLPRMLSLELSYRF